MDVVAPFVTADGEPTVLRKPRQRPLHHPSLCRPSFCELSTFFLAMRFLMRRLFSACAHFCRRRLCWRAVSRGASSDGGEDLYGIYRAHELLEYHRIVDVGGAHHHRERDVPSVDHNMALRAHLALIHRIRAGFRPPLAGTLAESKEVRSQSIRSASLNRPSNARCSRSYTPAFYHSLRRRQQVTLLPQPSPGQHLPRDAGEGCPVVYARFAAFGLGWFLRQKRLDDLPKLVIH